MGIEALIAALIGVAGTLGAFLEGKRRGKSQDLADNASEVAILQGTMTTLQGFMAELEKQLKAKDVLIAELYGRVQVLEGLVTQKADVEAVQREVEGVREVVDRIARAVCDA